MSDSSFNFVAFVEAKPITRLSSEYNNKLLYKIRDSFTETQQNLFVSSFYCYLNYHPTNDFVIDLDDVWKWLGFSQKVKAKELLEKNFIVDKDYKFLLSAQVKQTSDTRGGHNKQTFLMTIRTFKLFCIKAGTEKANEIHEYFVKLEDIVNELIYEESNEMKEKMQKNILLLEKNEQEKQQLQNKFVQLEEENKRLQELKAAVPVIYVYNTNVQLENPDIKIGYSTNIHNRMSEFNTSGKRGKFEYTVEVFDIEVRHIEKIIHIMLSKYRVGGELFKIKVDEAIMVIKRIMNTLKLVNLDDVEERQMKMKKLHDIESNIIDNVYIDKDNTREMSCQTMEEEFIEEKTNIIKDELTIKFDKFIEDHCIVRNDVEVSCTDIIGLYRIVNKSASKEVYQRMLSYLSSRFKPSRLKYQNKDQVVNGYSGVTLNHIDYSKCPVDSNEQNFIFHSCVFSPSGKVLLSELTDEYKKWKKQVNIPVLENDEKMLRDYLNDTGYVLYTTIWAKNGNGVGYYGIYLKKDVDKHRLTSSTGKKVEKRSKDSHALLGTWETIAKAAEAEKMCAAKMSRSIKNAVIFNDDYYYCTA